ncbi:11599_t:CDS:2 [Paraglomus brasilianum]|uniref:Cytochrome b-c1 complex subunit 8 n=1 Tax=Paraglomus brasilianum TaxID=144538 RepID=A0A9N9AGK3_9GLOM|nr:11599_t:CDS:2 [Paraglomus brasilianum]
MGEGHSWWGHMGGPVQRGVVTYSISPYQQRAFAGALKHGIFNTYRRVASQSLYIGIPFVLGYFIYTEGKKKHEYYHTKAGIAEMDDDIRTKDPLSHYTFTLYLSVSIK